VEVLWPWMPIILIWAGLFLSDFGKRLGSKPPPPRELPPWMLWLCLASALFTVGGTLAFWYAVRIPWATMLAAWILVCVSGGAVVWLCYRSLGR
jgi:hypothetical protein